MATYNFHVNEPNEIGKRKDRVSSKELKMAKTDLMERQSIKLKDLIPENVSQSELNQVEKYLDKVWAKVGVDVEFTRHCMDRVNDVRNIKPISPAQLIRIYIVIYKKYGKPISKLPDGVNILLKDMGTNINVPVVLRWNGRELEMIAKTIMRKKNFKSSTKKYSV